MSRYIDADALKEEFTCKGDEWINNIIDSEPTIDAVSVVRCKECKHYKYTEGFEHGRYEAGYGCELGLRQVTADDFCSYGSYGERSDT